MGMGMKISSADVNRNGYVGMGGNKKWE